jgi:hypothetical protein
MPKPIFHKIKKSPSQEKRQRITKNRADFNLRMALEEAARKKRGEMTGSESPTVQTVGGFMNFDDGSKSTDDLKGGCVGGHCDTGEGTGVASGESNDNRLMTEKMADFLMNRKRAKYERIKNRQDRLRSDWREGFGSRGRGVVMYNPVNRIRQNIAASKLFRLKKRHPGSQSGKI